MLANGAQLADQANAELGDVQATLRQIQEAVKQLQVAPTPQVPFQQGQLATWLHSIATTRQQAEALFKPLPNIAQKAYLPNNTLTVEQGGAFDAQDVDRLMRYLQQTAGKIDTELEQFNLQLDTALQHIPQELTFYNSFDPTNPQHQSNHFLGEGRYQQVLQQMQSSRLQVSEALQYAQLLNQPTIRQRQQLLAEVDKSIATYQDNYAKARKLIRMPEPASKDKKLQKIAQSTLSSYDYVGRIETLVINTDISHHKKETSEEEFDKVDVSLSGTITLSGTRTTYFYEWDEFQVATAEPVGDTYYIFYSTLRYFTSGASTTPLNKWIIGQRFQGSEIPKGNL